MSMRTSTSPCVHRTGVDVDAAVRLARDGRADRVGYAEHERAALLAVAQREQRVRRLARLRDEHAHVVAATHVAGANAARARECECECDAE